MRVIQADFIFDGQQLYRRGWLQLKEGKIADWGPEEELLVGLKVEKFTGLIGPGWVNAHCHLELSHLKNKIPRHTGLPGFIGEVQQVREASQDEKEKAIQEAYDQLMGAGVVAVGDICNGTDSISVKGSGNIQAINFIELFGFNPQDAEMHLGRGLALQNQFLQAGLEAHVVAHAPYSVSEKLFLGISALKPQVFSVHNQECAAEDEMFTSGAGLLVDRLKSFGIPMDQWSCPEKSSLQWMRGLWNDQQALLLVHNTFTSENELEELQSHSGAVFLCTCPKANLYIEGRLPDYSLWLKHGVQVCIGTDSLASNDKLCIWSEIQSIRSEQPEIPLEKILQWATSNGAKALGLNKRGKFEKGNMPGLVHVPDLNGLESKVFYKPE